MPEPPPGMKYVPCDHCGDQMLVWSTPIIEVDDLILCPSCKYEEDTAERGRRWIDNEEEF